MRVIGWILTGLILSLIPLVIVAVTKVDANVAFLAAITDEELLAVAFTLAGASGIDALISSSHPALRGLQVTIGGLAIVSAIACAGFYVVFKLDAHHLTPDVTRTVEGSLYVASAFLSLFSEIVA